MATCYEKDDTSLYKKAIKQNHEFDDSIKTRAMQAPGKVAFGEKCKEIADSNRLNLVIHRGVRYNDKKYVIAGVFYENERGMRGTNYVVVFKNGEIIGYDECSYT